MIDRVVRKHIYSMNRAALPVVALPEPDEALEYKWISLPMPRRRLPGEALVKFGPPGPCGQKPEHQSLAPFHLFPRAPKTRRLVSAPDGAQPPKKRPHIGQEIWIDGKPASLTWLGETKFEVTIAGRKVKLRLKHSDYPGIRRGEYVIDRFKSESNNVAS